MHPFFHLPSTTFPVAIPFHTHLFIPFHINMLISFTVKNCSLPILTWLHGVRHLFLLVWAPFPLVCAFFSYFCRLSRGSQFHSFEKIHTCCIMQHSHAQAQVYLEFYLYFFRCPNPLGPTNPYGPKRVR